MGVIASAAAVTYGYPGRPEPALREVSVVLERGETLLLIGPSGCGKSTFLRLFNGLVPQFYGGQLAGQVLVAGMDASRTPTRRLAATVGMVFQEPEAQAIADTVRDEVAFGMEQHGVARTEMTQRLATTLEAVGVAHLAERRLTTLSGGERQRVAIASALALRPGLLLLDEPTSQLDPDGAETLLDLVDGLRVREGMTVLLAEHRLERAWPLASRVAVFEGGAVAVHAARSSFQSPAVPPVVALARRLDLSPAPLTVAEARDRLEGRALRVRLAPTAATPGDVLLAAEGATVSYGGLNALAGVDFAVHEGEVVALTGKNGSGKTTLLRGIAGTRALDEGHVWFRGQPAPVAVRERTAFCGMVPQDPAIALYQRTVAAEVLETMKLRRLRPDAALLDRWSVRELQDRDPHDISVGQQQRVAVAAMLAHEPPVWLLDEPTRGADVVYKTWLAGRLRDHARAGGAVVVATHDVEFAASVASRAVGLRAGKVAFDLPARRAFGHDGPLATQTAQVVPGALFPEEVCA
ncbi:MAG: ABC transporter ATP-binding protein [Dehalococcoidia bacterium]